MTWYDMVVYMTVAKGIYYQFMLYLMTAWGRKAFLLSSCISKLDRRRSTIPWGFNAMPANLHNVATRAQIIAPIIIWIDSRYALSNWGVGCLGLVLLGYYIHTAVYNAYAQGRTDPRFAAWGWSIANGRRKEFAQVFIQITRDGVYLPKRVWKVRTLITSRILMPSV